MTWKASAVFCESGIQELVHTTMRRLYGAAKSLKQFPHRGRIGRKDGTRELIIAPLPYVIVYGVELEQDLKATLLQFTAAAMLVVDGVFPMLTTIGTLPGTIDAGMRALICNTPIGSDGAAPA